MCVILCFCMGFMVASAAEYDEEYEVLVNVDQTKTTKLVTYEQRYYAIPFGYDHFIAFYDSFSGKYRICFYTGNYKFDHLSTGDQYYWDYFYSHSGFYADKMIVYSFNEVDDLYDYLTNDYEGEIISSSGGTYTRLPCNLNDFYFTDQNLRVRTGNEKYSDLIANDPVNYDYYLVRRSLGFYDFESILTEIGRIVVIIIPFIVSFLAFRKSWKFIMNSLRAA